MYLMINFRGIIAPPNSNDWSNYNCEIFLLFTMRLVPIYLKFFFNFVKIFYESRTSIKNCVRALYEIEFRVIDRIEILF